MPSANAGDGECRLLVPCLVWLEIPNFEILEPPSFIALYFLYSILGLYMENILPDAMVCACRCMCAF